MKFHTRICHFTNYQTPTHSMMNSHRISLSNIYPFVDEKNDSWFCDPQGVEIVNDDEGNVWATRGSKNAVFVKVG